MLVLTRKIDEKIIINDQISVTIVGVEGERVKLGIDAPADIEIHREEVYRSIEKENINAAKKNLEPEQLNKFQKKYKKNREGQ